MISRSWTGPHTWEWPGCKHAYLIGFLFKRYLRFRCSVQPLTNNTCQQLWSLSAIRGQEKLRSPLHHKNESISETEDGIMDETMLNIYWWAVNHRWFRWPNACSYWLLQPIEESLGNVKYNSSCHISYRWMTKPTRNL